MNYTLEEVVRRLDRLENKMDQGFLVHQDAYEARNKDFERRIQSLEKDVKWMIRGLVIATLTVVLQAALTIAVALLPG